MNPLLATCCIGLLTLGVGAAVTPDVVPVIPAPVVVPAPVIDGLGADMPTPPEDARREAEGPELDVEVFSRRMLPPRPESSLAVERLAPAAIDARITDDVMTPLGKRALDVRSYSRVRLPRAVFRHEYVEGTAQPKAPEDAHVAFRLTRTMDFGPSEPAVIAEGRVHRTTGAVELRVLSDKAPTWDAAEAAVKRLARLR